MSHWAKVGIGFYVVWLLAFWLLLSSNTIDPDLVGLWGTLPLWGPLLAIAVLTTAAWVERRLRKH